MRLPALIAALLLSLAACAAPTPTADTSPAQPEPAASSTQPAPMPPAATPAPAPSPADPAPASSGGTVAIDATCKTNADCTVKNVGNCCGYYPACVNVNSPTDPKGVQAECAKKGMMSVCGFKDISACTCNQGKCEASGAEQLQ